MRVKVNPLECTAHGLCAELLPEWVQVDEWGYPVVESQPVPEQLVKRAKRAAAACPTLALKLLEE